MTREFTTKLLDMIDDGLLDKDTVIMACAQYMSEDDVRDMMFANDFVEDTDDWDEDEARTRSLTLMKPKSGMTLTLTAKGSLVDNMVKPCYNTYLNNTKD